MEASAQESTGGDGSSSNDPSPSQAQLAVVQAPEPDEKKPAEQEITVSNFGTESKTPVKTAAVDRDAGGTSFQITASRRKFGYWTMMAAGIGILGLAFYAFRSIDKMIADKELLGERLWIAVGSHGVVTVAVIYFLYQVLRAGERLSIPYWWVERHVDGARLALGINDPARTVQKAVVEIAETAAKLK